MSTHLNITVERGLGKLEIGRENIWYEAAGRAAPCLGRVMVNSNITDRTEHFG